MEKALGPIDKMRTEDAETVRYLLAVGEARVPLNERLGHKVRFKHTGRIFCIHCGARTKNSFAQGYCYRCFQGLAQCDLCIMRPETCHHHRGTCREPEWGQTNCMVEHVVYLANSSGIKVGITRAQAMRTRWMDQGATQALPIVRVATRRDSGLVEYALSEILPDKTNWRLMLQGEAERIDLKARRDELFAQWPEGLPGEKLFAEELGFKYPVIAYPEKPAAFTLEKQPEVSGHLLGVKGQYLIFDSGVINIRKYAGYELEWESEPSEYKPSAEALFRQKAREAAAREAQVEQISLL